MQIIKPGIMEYEIEAEPTLSIPLANIYTFCSFVEGTNDQEAIVYSNIQFDVLSLIPGKSV